MPRRSTGPRLWLRKARRRADGRGLEAAVWVIRDGGRQISTGCGAGEREQAEQKLAEHIVSKHAPSRRERPLSEILVADVIKIYLDDVAPGQARPEKAAERARRLLAHFGAMTLDQVTGAECRRYAETRIGQGNGRKGTEGGARRDLQDLAAAINHHAREGYHRGVVSVALPGRGKARQRWLTRDEMARLLWVCWRTRETQEGSETERRPLRHLCRFLLLGLYTGSRPGAILNAAWFEGPTLSYVDLDNGVFHRHAAGERETQKRQPTVRIAPGLAAHLRRWAAIDAKKNPRPVYVVTFGGARIASVKTALARASTLAELDAGVTAYTLRHTAASWLTAKGVHTRKIAEFIGTTEEMVRNHYGHLAPDYQDEAAQAIGRK